jgi:hypothetical protein
MSLYDRRCFFPEYNHKKKKKKKKKRPKFFLLLQQKNRWLVATILSTGQLYHAIWYFVFNTKSADQIRQICSLIKISKRIPIFLHKCVPNFSRVDDEK